MDAGDSPSDLELTAGVVYLDPGHRLGQLEATRCHPGPVRMREVRDTTVFDDPRPRAGKVESLSLDRIEAVDAVGEHVAVSVAGEEAVQLCARNHEQSVGRGRITSRPVVCDCEHVVAGTLVVLDEGAWRQLPVRIRRMCVQRAAQPRSIDVPGACHQTIVLENAICKR